MLIAVAFVLVGIVIYCILAVLLKLPAFKSASPFKRGKKKSTILSDFVYMLSHKLSKRLNLTVMKRTKYSNMLAIADRKESPEEFLAKTYIETILPLPLAIPLYLLNPILAVVVLPICYIFYTKNISELEKEGAARKRNIETEIQRFVVYMANALKSSRNIINCIEIYIYNFNTPLTQELTYTIAEMRVGNQENALRAMERRNNSSAVSRLVRGLLSAMKGDDMSLYFDNLGYELTNEWEQTLERQALKKEPKISRLSFILFGISLVTVFVVMGQALFSAGSIFGGM